MQDSFFKKIETLYKYSKGEERKAYSKVLEIICDCDSDYLIIEKPEFINNLCKQISTKKYADPDSIKEILNDFIDKILDIPQKWNDKKVAFYLECPKCGALVKRNEMDIFYYCDGNKLNYCPNCGQRLER